jgi:hypothetical protein
MTRYAQQTDVTSDRSRAEIERTLRRYGAEQFMYGWDARFAVIAFRMRERRIQFRLPLPDRGGREFTHTETGRPRKSDAHIERAYEQAVRQRWRALALVIKAKLEAVNAGIAELEDEFLAHIVLPGGETVGQHVRPRIAEAYQTGTLPPLLPSPETGGH